MGKTRIGLAGLGASIIMHMQVAKYLEGAVFTAVMDLDRARVQDVMERYHVPHGYSDYDEMIESGEIDAVIIASPPNYHCEQTIKAARRRLHILCEKPMAPTLAECDRMIGACADAGVVLQVGFMKRYDQTMCTVKAMIDAGELGSVYRVQSMWHWYQIEGPISWRDKLTTGGGLYQDHGAHTTDLCRWWLGEVETVSAEIDRIKHGREVEDQAAVIYRHASGATSIHMHSRMTHRELTEFYQIDGEKCTLTIEYGGWWSGYTPEPFKLYLYREGRERVDMTVPRYGNVDEEIRTHGKYKLQMDDFVDCIVNGRQPMNSGSNGRAAIECILAAYRSSAERKKIELPLSAAHDASDFGKLYECIGKLSPPFRRDE